MGVRTLSTRRTTAAISCVAVVTGLLAAAGARSTVAHADSVPPAGTPATVTADGLPTVQMNGVAWGQAVAGNTVYVTGEFSKARPAGSALGQNEVTRSNLLAYDLTTGKLITSFNHALNGTGQAVAVSPDGTRVYVGGAFTTVDGTPHNRIVAFDTATGRIVQSFRAGLDATVRAMTVTTDTVYAGGNFSSANGKSRPNAAAFTTVSGALTTWNPRPDDVVTAVTMAPDKSVVVLGGKFKNLGSTARYGMGATDPSNGNPTTWTSNQIIHDAGVNSGITSLTSDSTAIYGTGYSYTGAGNFEGRFAMNSTGKLIWMNDCHGDSYSTVPIGKVLYSVSHTHYCTNMGAWPETNPRTFHRAEAETTYASGGVLKANVESGYANFAGQPDGTQLDWYPDLTIGTFTGQDQAAWNVTGNANYVALGGEFLKVNGVAQQGLVRMAVTSLATNKIGPNNNDNLIPKASSVSGGIKVTFGTTYDLDNAVLTYRLYRDGGSTALYTVSVDTRFWTAPSPTQTYTDKSAGGGSHTYRVSVTDPTGNRIYSGTSNSASQ